MEGVLNTTIKRIVFEGDATNKYKQDGTVYKNISYVNDTQISEAEYKFNEWLERVQNRLKNRVKKDIENIENRLEKAKDKDNEDKVEDLEDVLEEMEEKNILLDIISVNSTEGGGRKRIEVVYKIVEYMIDN